MLNLNKFLL